MLPQQLQVEITRARRYVVQHKRHTLQPSHGYKIYVAMGSRNDPIAQRILGKLALLTAQKVESVWLENRQNDQLVTHLLALAEAVLCGVPPIEKKAIRLKVIGLATLTRESSDDEFNKSLTAPASFALDEAIEALLEILDEALWQDWLWNYPESQNTKETNSDIDYWTSEATLWSSIAYAGGDWDGDSPHHKREEYWLW